MLTLTFSFLFVYSVSVVKLRLYYLIIYLLLFANCMCVWSFFSSKYWHIFICSFLYERTILSQKRNFRNHCSLFSSVKVLYLITYLLSRCLGGRRGNDEAVQTNCRHTPRQGTHYNKRQRGNGQTDSTWNYDNRLRYINLSQALSVVCVEYGQRHLSG